MPERANTSQFGRKKKKNASGMKRAKKEVNETTIREVMHCE